MTHEQFLTRVQARQPLRYNLARPCRLYAGRLNAEGYGIVDVDRKPVRVHRLAYALLVGPVPNDLDVLHHCDMPPCIEETHLFLGTQADNMQDMWSKGRGASGGRNGSRTHPERHISITHPERMARGERQALAKLTEMEVREIRRIYGTGGVSQTSLAHRFAVSVPTIFDVVRRITWLHVE